MTGTGVHRVTQTHHGLCVTDIAAAREALASVGFTRVQPGAEEPLRYADEPGMYLLRAEDREPLFVGRTFDLGRRLNQHDACPAIANQVAHVSLLTGDELPSEEYLDAFKEELVRRHRPRWNVNLVGLAAIPQSTRL